jgi:hypothetical protein
MKRIGAFIWISCIALIHGYIFDVEHKETFNGNDSGGK